MHPAIIAIVAMGGTRVWSALEHQAIKREGIQQGNEVKVCTKGVLVSGCWAAQAECEGRARGDEKRHVPSNKRRGVVRAVVDAEQGGAQPKAERVGGTCWRPENLCAVHPVPKQSRARCPVGWQEEVRLDEPGAKCAALDFVKEGRGETKGGLWKSYNVPDWPILKFLVNST
ncbi:hypothetical protein K438DRAFT_1749499 [Mycena galopus ATCC 62051]|nr:hypothetical protein K438DRAFT_1749499 [Mycena galopus ATCC 62051]